MTRSIPLVALLVAGCGRLGFEVLPEREGTGGAGTGGNATLDGGHSKEAGTGASPSDAMSTGGVPNSGGAGGTLDGGNGGTMAGGAGGALDAGTGGAIAAADGAGPRLDAGTGGTSSGGAGGAGTGGTGTGGTAGASSGGADAGGCVPTNGGVEICDGRDNDCSGAIDDAGTCPTRCSGRAYGSHGYMYCNNTTLYWDACRSACQAEGMDLAVVNDSGENQFLGDWVASKHSAAWYGGTDGVLEGDWRWVDGNAFWSSATGGAVGGAFTSWSSTEPDNGGTSGPDSDCLAVSWSQPYTWYDQRCQNFIDYVCEAP